MPDFGREYDYYTFFKRQKQGVLNCFSENFEKSEMEKNTDSKKRKGFERKHDCKRNILMEEVQLKIGFA